MDFPTNIYFITLSVIFIVVIVNFIGFFTQGTNIGIHISCFDIGIIDFLNQISDIVINISVSATRLSFEQK